MEQFLFYKQCSPTSSANNEKGSWKLHRWIIWDLDQPGCGKPVHLLHGNPCPLLPSLPCPGLANCSHSVWHCLAFYHSCGQESSRDLKAGPGGPRDLGPDSCSKGGLPRSHQARLHDLQLLCDQLLAGNGIFCTIQNVLQMTQSPREASNIIYSVDNPWGFCPWRC